MPPNISDAEWEVMKILWSGAPRTANEIIEELSGRTRWKPKTVRTLISRLLHKGVLRYEPRGREYAYWPTLEEAACALEQTQSFLDRVFGGALAPMVAQLTDQQALSPKDVAALRALLDQHDGQKSRQGRKRSRGGKP